MMDRKSAGTRRILTIAAGGALVLTGLGSAWAPSAGAAPAAAQDKVRLVRVSTPTPQLKQRLGALGLDLTESAGRAYIDVVLHSAADAATLRRAGMSWQVRVADLAAADARARQADKNYAAKNAVSPLPSGRTTYRTLGDYETEMSSLARQHPGLVQKLTLPYRTLEGRRVQGIEVGHRVRSRDGRPVFLMMGLHHAREWPSGELTMEFAYDLVKNDQVDTRITRLLDTTRVIFVPVVNPDGFDKSRGGGGQEFKRKNCRIIDGRLAPPPLCSLEDNWQLGVDPNRNYGFGWGGTGASTVKTASDYFGQAPFSEPEVRNIRDLVSNHQVTTLITNHTFASTVLRPPFTQMEGEAPDEPAFKALSDAMTAQNGYTGLKSADDYETTGETPDWSYYATRGLGYTVEIGVDSFHPPFATGVIDEYLGKGAYAGKGNRGAYLVAWQNAADRAAHSVIKGRAPRGAVLTIAKRFVLWTSPVKQPDGTVGKPLPVPTKLTSSMVAPGGRFSWDVNPSVRPRSPFTAEGQAPATGFVREQWTLTCARPNGRVLQTVKVLVGRGGQAIVDLNKCGRR